MKLHLCAKTLYVTQWKCSSNVRMTRCNIHSLEAITRPFMGYASLSTYVDAEFQLVWTLFLNYTANFKVEIHLRIWTTFILRCWDCLYRWDTNYKNLCHLFVRQVDLKKVLRQGNKLFMLKNRISIQNYIK